jgi:hypothetical protein
VAAFPPTTSLHTHALAGSQRSAILIHEKSPLLVATPPQITRALAYSHPFVSALNYVLGLLSWTTGDPWESFLVVASFWATVLYGDYIIRWGGPLVVVSLLILAMYARRYSLLSSSVWTGQKRAKTHRRGDSASQLHSLEDIVDTLNTFHSKCNILLEPCLKMTEFLSTQTTATAATTKPALTALLFRIILVTPVWIILTLPPLYIITTKRVVLAVGTLVLTWHSQPARVTRTIFWRSKLVRRISAITTGLGLCGDALDPSTSSLPRRKSAHELAVAMAAKREADSPAIQFTFCMYENQRRWLLIGWTSSMLAYERGPWTDEHNGPVDPPPDYELPAVENANARWEWLPDSYWHVVDTDGTEVKDTNDPVGGGWIYYDNKASLPTGWNVPNTLQWQNGRRGRDGWGKYTRRRKWCREAQLVEVLPTDSRKENAAPRSSEDSLKTPTRKPADAASSEAPSTRDDDESLNSTRKRRTWFSRRSSQPSSEKSAALSGASGRSAAAQAMEDDEDAMHLPLGVKQADRSAAWGMADDPDVLFG